MSNGTIDLEWDPVRGIYRKLTPAESRVRGIIQDCIYVGAVLAAAWIAGRILS